MCRGGSGGEDGHVKAFDLRDGTEVASHAATADTVNGFEFHPCLPLAALASGERRFPLDLGTSDDETDGEAATEVRLGGGAAGRAGQRQENCLLVWRFGSEWLPIEAVEPSMRQHTEEPHGTATANGALGD
jgi:hypothetical protein